MQNKRQRNGDTPSSNVMGNPCPMSYDRKGLVLDLRSEIAMHMAWSNGRLCLKR